MNIRDFINKYLGKRVDTDGFPRGELYQCVDLIKEYVNKVYGVPLGSFGNAIDYYYNTHPNILLKFHKLTGVAPQEGDIVVLKGLGGNKYGHITIATGHIVGELYEALEQNGSTGSGSGLGGDSVRKRMIPLSRIVGVLRPKVAAAAGSIGHIEASTSTGASLYLPASAGLWRVYALDQPVKKGYEKAKLNPGKFGGLRYTIVKMLAQNIAVIDTQMFGRVKIWVGPDTPAIITK